MSVCERARWVEMAANNAECCVSALAESLMAEGVSERSFALLKQVVFAISDVTPAVLEDVRFVDGKVYVWNAEVTNGR